MPPGFQKCLPLTLIKYFHLQTEKKTFLHWLWKPQLKLNWNPNFSEFTFLVNKSANMELWISIFQAIWWVSLLLLHELKTGDMVSSWFRDLKKIQFVVLLLYFEKLGLELDIGKRTTKNDHYRIYSLWVRLGYIRLCCVVGERVEKFLAIGFAIWRKKKKKVPVLLLLLDISGSGIVTSIEIVWDSDSAT